MPIAAFSRFVRNVWTRLLNELGDAFTRAGSSSRKVVIAVDGTCQAEPHRCHPPLSEPQKVPPTSRQHTRGAHRVGTFAFSRLRRLQHLQSLSGIVGLFRPCVPQQVRCATGAIHLQRCHPRIVILCFAILSIAIVTYVVGIIGLLRSTNEGGLEHRWMAPSCLRHLCACVLELNLDEAVEGVKCAIHRCDSPPQRRRSLR